MRIALLAITVTAKDMMTTGIDTMNPEMNIKVNTTHRTQQGMNTKLSIAGEVITSRDDMNSTTNPDTEARTTVVELTRANTLDCITDLPAVAVPLTAMSVMKSPGMEDPGRKLFLVRIIRLRLKSLQGTLLWLQWPTRRAWPL